MARKLRPANRLFDLSVAVLLTALTLPLMLIVALGVKFSSPGPIIYRASRVGSNGGEFTMLKFRTMIENTADNAPITAPDDPRITSLGRILRRFKLDELPQLINVLKGEMSIVGPRPEAPEIVSRYYDDLMRQSLAVRPALTGPGTLLFMQQFTSGVQNENPTESYAENLLQQRIDADLDYLEHRNVLSDLMILGKTGLVLVSKLLGYQE